ncbi:MAG: hypothetical protein J6O62_03705 [Bacilli bacterium]|nr:hypothetical protein [Bacilli bacterium]MBO6194834.1 hypothetical protein [Bacilli bacterium]
MELSIDEKEHLLKQSYAYRYEKENNEKAKVVLENIINNLQNTFIENGNEISYKCSRIKTENSLLNKILKRYRNGKIENFEDMHDIVGIRLICLSPSDVYEFEKLIDNCDELKVVNKYGCKDYIKKPKESGYMSLHKIVEVPIETSTGIKYVQCEIQLRTIFQDMISVIEHKLGYKGAASDTDKKKFSELSAELYSYDYALDNLFKIENYKPKEFSIEELKECRNAYEKIKPIYNLINGNISPLIDSCVKEYKNNEDILHVVSRYKSEQSMKRKLDRNSLSCTPENILYNIRDGIGYKIVCVDEKSTKEFIEVFKEKIEASNLFKITDTSNWLDNPKPSGYRGYKMNIAPIMVGNKDINIEILFTTTVNNAWTQHHDKVFNNEDCYSSSEDYMRADRQLKGFSFALHRLETELSELIQKYKEMPTIPPRDLVSEIEQYKLDKDTQVLKFIPNKNGE